MGEERVALTEGEGQGRYRRWRRGGALRWAACGEGLRGPRRMRKQHCDVVRTPTTLKSGLPGAHDVSVGVEGEDHELSGSLT